MDILLTCPPMLNIAQTFMPMFSTRGVRLVCPKVVQTLSEDELIKLVPQFDGWIIGDDPATEAVFTAGKKGRLKAAVKWGVGVDNIDFSAANKLEIPISNTPNMFGDEVADIAMSYITALARETFLIDREVRSGGWPKPTGISLTDKKVALVGYGDIGKSTAKRLLAANMEIIVYDPNVKSIVDAKYLRIEEWPDDIENADFIVLTCSLTKHSRHLINSRSLSKAKQGVRIVNVARGPLIDEGALLQSLQTGRVHSAALDVFEVEPLPIESPLREFGNCIFGSHNASNTQEGVYRTSERAIELLFDFLGIS